MSYNLLGSRNLIENPSITYMGICIYLIDCNI